MLMSYGQQRGTATQSCMISGEFASAASLCSVPSSELLQFIYNVVVCKMQCIGRRSETDKIKVLPPQSKIDVEKLEGIPEWALNPLGLRPQLKVGTYLSS